MGAAPHARPSFSMTKTQAIRDLFAYYLRYVGRIWSATLTLVVTIERYLFMAHPLKKEYFQKHNIHRILIPVTLIVCLLCVMYAPFLIGLQLNKVHNVEQCIVLEDTKTVFVILDIAIVRGIGDLLIGGFILLFTLLSIKALCKARRIRTETLHETSLCESCGAQYHRTNKKNNYKSRESQITKMLLILAILFIVFKIPYTLCYYVNFYVTSLKHDKSLTPSLGIIVFGSIRSMSACFAMMNYGLNFLVYIIWVPSFRKNLITAFRC